jgi:hypothetical protein
VSLLSKTDPAELSGNFQIKGETFSTMRTKAGGCFSLFFFDGQQHFHCLFISNSPRSAEIERVKNPPSLIPRRTE